MAKSVQELKEIILDLEISLARATVPRGHCVYAYYYSDDFTGCGDDCTECAEEFWEKFRKQKSIEIENL